MIFDRDPAASFASRPQIVLGSGDNAPALLADPPDPPTNGALLSAVQYVFATWESGHGPASTDEPYVQDREPITEHWGHSLTEILDRLGTLVGVEEDEPSGAGLLELRSGVLAARRGSEERRTLLKRLKNYWGLVGKEAGVIPDFEGGRKVQLRGDFLGSLLEEARELVEAVVDHQVTEAEVDAVRDLYLTGET